MAARGWMLGCHQPQALHQFGEGAYLQQKEHTIVSTYITKMFGSPLKKDFGVGI